MKFNTILENVSKSSTDGIISHTDRSTLYNNLATMTAIEAKIIYEDLCYVYLCVVNETDIDYSKIKLLKNIKFNVSFVRSLLDLGSLIDKLADVTDLNEHERKAKWKAEKIQWENERHLQKNNANANSKWSKFLFESRERNRRAYDEKVKRLHRKDNSNFAQIIKLSYTELQKQPPTLFFSIQYKHLNNSEKRALLYKYSIIYNLLPDAVRHDIVHVFQDLFKDEMMKKNSPNCCSVC